MPAAEERSSRADSERKLQTILLTDDEIEVLDLCKRVLERAGFKVLCSDDPRKALELFEANKEAVDVLVADVVMPGMSGPELADSLVASKPELKVLFISGIVPSAADVFAALRHHFPFRFLRKPFSPGLLVEFVRDMLHAEAARGAR